MDLRNLGTRRKQNTTGTSKTHQVQAKRDQINTMGTAMRFPRYPKNHQTRATRRQIKSNRLPKSAQKKKRKKQTEQTGNKKKKAQVTSPPPDHPKNASQLEFISNPYNNRQESRPNSTEKNPRDAKNKKFTLLLLLPGFLLPLLLLGRRLALCFERAPKTLFYESFCWVFVGTPK